MKTKIRFWTSLFSLLCFGFCLVSVAGALDVGKPAPDFTAQTSTGKAVSLRDYHGKVVVLEWFNAGCPFVKHQYDSGSMQELQDFATKAGVVWLTVNSTNSEHKDFLNAEAAEAYRAQHSVKSTEYLIDGKGSLGHLYGAQTTPHMFVINAQGQIVYQGAIDNNPGLEQDAKSALNYVRQGLTELQLGKSLTVAETKSYGCSVKYAS